MKKKIGYSWIVILLMGFLFIVEPVSALVDIKPTGMQIINGSGGNTYTRKVATAIGIYTKNGTVPGVRKYSGTYEGVKYNVLEVDVSDTNGTFVQVDYAGYNKSDFLPKYLNGFYDTNLTKNDEYYWVGSINTGFFTNSSTANNYGYPTGAVKKNGEWQTYTTRNNSETLETTPSYGSGFVTAYFNKNKEFELIYNGWKDGNFYKYIDDPTPNSWEYGDHVKYSEGISGAYTLMVNGDSTIHWGKNDYKGTDFWNYNSSVSLFGQKANGNYLLVTTEGTFTAPQQVALMTELGSVNGIRFDGGGSTQMTYDDGFLLDHFFFGKTNTEIEQGSSLDTSDVYFDLYMGKDQAYYYATAADTPHAEYFVFDMSGNLVEDLSKADVGEYWLKVEMNGLEQQIKIKVVESANKHTVIFDYNDGTTTSSKQLVEDGLKVDQPTDPVREGYTFQGWQLNGTPFDFNSTIIENLTLTASWKINEYTITFDSVGGSNIASQTKEYLSKVAKPTNPTKEGYTFQEWQYQGSTFDFNTNITGNMTLTAVWKINEYPITFHTNGGSEIATEMKEHFSTVTKPVDPVRQGYTFQEWQLNGTVFDFSTIVTGPITLEAIWKINEYTITFNTDGGNLIESQTKEYLTTVDRPVDPVKQGYTFVEWQLNGSTYDFDAGITNNMTLTAVWEINKYQITFDSDGGSSVVSQMKEYLATVDQPINPTKVGYTFIEWQQNGTTFNFNTKVTDNIALKAIWKINEYQIAFDSKGGTMIPSQTKEYFSTVDQPVTPTKTGYTFQEWQLNGSTFDFTTKVTDDMTLTAVWKINEYQITFDSNGGSEVPSQTIEYLSTITKPTVPTKEGYIFQEWQLDGTIFDFTTRVTENMTLTAVWKPGEYQIVFDTDGGNEIGAQTKKYLETIDRPVDPVKQGYTFQEWQLDGASFDFTTKVTNNITLKAIWKINEYTITFNSSGGTKVTDQTKEYLSTITQPENPTKVGYTFVEWQHEGVKFDFQAKVTENLTLTAVWKINEYKITFDTDGGNQIETQTKEYLSTIDQPEDPTKQGYTFMGWQYNGSAFDFGTKVTDHMTLTAIWKANEYQITFDSDGGSPVTSQTKEYLSSVDQPTNPTKEGYTFIEWQLNGSKFDFQTKVTEDLNLKAIWKINEYTITFNTTGGTTIEPQKKEHLSMIDKPADPTKEGYTFQEWQYNGSTFNFNTKITNDITLIAVWNINEYQITFDSDGGTAITSQTKEYLSTVTKPENPTKEGYTFIEWQQNGKTFYFDTEVTESITLKAVWKINEYQITFETNGGSEVAMQTKEHLSTVDQPITPTKTGYTFQEWQLNGSTYDFNAKVTGNLTLTAVWEINEYQITFDTDGGTKINGQTKQYLSFVDQPTNPTKEGYTFIEWQYNGTCFDFHTAVTEDLVLKAIWKINEYEITFDSNGGTSVPSQRKEYGKTLNEPVAPTKEGYTFQEWQYNGSTFDFATTVTQNMTLKAVWKIDTYTVTFDTKGGSAIESQTKEYLGTIDQPVNPNKPGYTFIEWEYHGSTFDFTTKVTSDITLTAKYELVIPDIEATSGYEVDGNNMKLPVDMKIESFSLGLSDIYMIKVKNAKGEEKITGKLGTGDQVQIMLDDTLVSHYTVIVKGDITGDGMINVADVGKLYQYLKKKVTMDTCYVKAGNIVSTEEIRITDVGKLYQFIKGKISSLGD